MTVIFCVVCLIVSQRNVYGRNFSTDVSLQLDWLDRLPGTESPEFEPESLGESPAAEVGARSLGLTKAEVNLVWSIVKSSRLRLTLRPDAGLTRHEPAIKAREFDRRAGRTYRKASAVNLLDSYVVSVMGGGGFGFGFGVWDKLVPAHSSYPELLEFGLRVKFVEKYLGMDLQWKQSSEVGAQNSVANFSAVNFTESLIFHVLVFSGREDRGELYGIGSNLDRAPVLRDPHWGGAALVTGGSESLSWEVIGGYDDSLVSGQKIQERFGAASASKAFVAFGELGKITSELRYSKENWPEAEVQKPSVVQLSFSSSLSYFVSDSSRVVLGYHRGKSEYHNEDDSIETEHGNQYDIGLFQSNQVGLQFGLLIGREYRYVGESKSQGVFSGSDSLDRIALNVVYSIRE